MVNPTVARGYFKKLLENAKVVSFFERELPGFPDRI
jgi:hypothetical protein